MPIIEPSLQHPTSTILLVEDDMAVRIQLSFALSGKYTVLQGRDGVEAVHLFEKNADSIFAVITDLELPRLGGDIVAEWIRSIRPDMPIIFISGSELGENSFEELRVNNRTWFLAKPFDVTDLETLIENAVAEPRTCDCHKPDSDFVTPPIRAAKTG